jgi:shikimate dehydrogenase
MSKRHFFTVVGKPILHSKSPPIYNSVFEKDSIDALFTRMSADDPEEVMSLYREIGLSGMTVTAPLKAGIMQFLDEIDDEAARIGSVNVIVTDGERRKGYNTDHIGVLGCFDSRKIVLEAKRCVVLGAGGAGRAAAYGLCKRGADVVLVNRTYERAVEAARAFRCRAARMERIESELESADIFVSAISQGVDIVDTSRLRSGLIVLDANYRDSPLLNAARERGCTVIGGEEWLLNQAVPACKHLTGIEPDRSLMERALLLGEAPRTGRCISLIGFAGSGKTLVGRMLADKLKFKFLDTDEEIELAEKLSIPEIFDKKGEAYFRALEKALFEDLKSLRDTVISCGGGAVLDAANRDILKSISTVFWIHAMFDTCLHRIEKGSRPLLDREGDIDGAMSLYQTRIPYYFKAADVIVGGERSPLPVSEVIYEEMHKSLAD